MVDIRFQVISNQKWSPTTHKQAFDLTRHLTEVVEAHTSASDRCPIEGAIAALYASYVHFCKEAGYDPIGVAELLLARDDGISTPPAYHEGGRA